MTISDLMITLLISSTLIGSMTQSTQHIYQSLQKQQTMSLLQSEGLQALQMMGYAIQGAHLSKDQRGFRFMAKDSAGMSHQQITQFQVRKGGPSLEGSDAFYTQHGSSDQPYQAFFLQYQGHHQQRDGVLYLQRKNKKGHLQSDALIGHVKSLQVQAGIIQKSGVQWFNPYEIEERASSKRVHWKQIRLVKINLKLQKGQHQLELEKIFTIRSS